MMPEEPPPVHPNSGNPKAARIPNVVERVLPIVPHLMAAIPSPPHPKSSSVLPFQTNFVRQRYLGRFIPLPHNFNNEEGMGVEQAMEVEESCGGSGSSASSVVVGGGCKSLIMAVRKKNVPNFAVRITLKWDGEEWYLGKYDVPIGDSIPKEADWWWILCQVREAVNLPEGCVFSGVTHKGKPCTLNHLFDLHCRGVDVGGDEETGAVNIRLTLTAPRFR